jgi:hypothetical protein
VQVGKIQVLIDRELQRLEREYHPGEQVVRRVFPTITDILLNLMKNHLILSGGLSNSAYVQEQIRKRYSSNANNFSNARLMNVWVAPDPQLAVCKGLVEDQSRKATTGKHVIEQRCCRASYGTICKEKYDEKNYRHQGRRVVKDGVDGKQYVVDAIEWFIRKVKFSSLPSNGFIRMLMKYRANQCLQKIPSNEDSK